MPEYSLRQLWFSTPIWYLTKARIRLISLNFSCTDGAWEMIKLAFKEAIAQMARISSAQIVLDQFAQTVLIYCRSELWKTAHK